MRRLKVTGVLLGVLFLIISPGGSYALGQFVYVNHNTSINRVSAFRAEPNGTLIEIAGSPFATEGQGQFFSASAILASPKDDFLYVANNRSGNVSVFSVDPVTGFLTLVPGAPFRVTDPNPFNDYIRLAVTPDNHFLFAAYSVGQGLATLKIFAISPSGALSLVANPYFNFAFRVIDFKVSPNGQFLFVFDGDLNGVWIYSIGSDGVLRRLPGTVQFDDSGRLEFFGNLEINCAGDSLYVVENSSNIHRFNIGADGSLSAAPGEPFVFPGSRSLLLSPDGRFLFVTGGGVRVHNADVPGFLPMIPGSPFSTGSSVLEMDKQINRAGTLLYLIGFGKIGVLSVGGNGALTLASEYSVPSRWIDKATVATYPAKTCRPFFDICVQTSSSQGSALQFNSTTGDYQFCCQGTLFTGKGTITRRGSTFTLEHNATDRRVLAKIDQTVHSGSASIQSPPGRILCTIRDTDTADNDCSCR